MGRYCRETLRINPNDGLAGIPPLCTKTYCNHPPGDNGAGLGGGSHGDSNHIVDIRC